MNFTERVDTRAVNVALSMVLLSHRNNGYCSHAGHIAKNENDRCCSNNKACVYFFDKRYFRGVMLKGTMEVLHDSKTKDMIWRDGDEMYYPKGVTDPD